jgi:hypothetical protein
MLRREGEAVRVLRVNDSIEALAGVTLPESSGGEVRLGDLWKDRPTVLVWLRHYG